MIPISKETLRIKNRTVKGKKIPKKKTTRRKNQKEPPKRHLMITTMKIRVAA